MNASTVVPTGATTASQDGLTDGTSRTGAARDMGTGRRFD
jgi:hypothetical protein